MQGNNNGMAFMQGVIFGALVGATAGILLAPKSGAETRADIAAAAKKYQEKAQDVYEQARASLERKIAALKKAGDKIDSAKYKKLVDNVISEMQSTSEITEKHGKALGAQLKADSGDVMTALKA